MLKKYFILVGILSPALALASTGYEFDFDRESLRIAASNAQGATLDMTIPLYDIKNETVGGGQYSRIDIPGWGVTGEFGKPELPVISKAIALPAYASVEYTVAEIESEIIRDIDIKPLEYYQSDNPSVRRPDFVKDDQLYARDEFYPAQRVVVSDPVIMRDLRMARVTICPFSYNPARRELKVVKRLRVELSFVDKPNPVNPKTNRRGMVSASMSPVYRSIAQNFDDVNTDEVTTLGGYLFIVPNTTTAATLQPLVDWKKEKGYPVTVAKTSEIGTTLTSIYNYIHNAYFTWENPPEFVVLVGDQDGSIQITTDHYNCGFGDNAVTDLYYSKLEGNDYFPDVLLGRLSVRSQTELTTVVNKIIGYETLSMPVTTWITKAEMIADNSNLSCQLTKEYAKEECERNGYTQVYEDYFNWGAPVTTISSHINSGVGIVNFRGYLGWGGYDEGPILALQNYWKLPVVNGCTCETGSFEITTCISEAWLRAGSPNSPAGGMGCVGPSSWNTHTKWNNCLDSGFMFGFLHDDIEHWGAVISRGKYELWTTYPFNQGSGTPANSVECYYHIYNLIGDPGLSVRTAAPVSFLAAMEDSIPFGSNYYGVTVNDNAHIPVEGAYVCLWKGTEIYTGGFTDENGEVNLPIFAQSAGAMKVCVTKQNYIPVRKTVQIVFGDSLVGVSTYSVDDDMTPPSSGNGDGVVNPGETIALNVQAQNFGSGDIYGIIGEIDCSSEYFTPLSVQGISYGSIVSGGLSWGQNPFTFAVSPQCPNGEYLEIIVDFRDSQNTHWQSLIPLTVESAELAGQAMQLPGAGTNNLLDPGETSDMIITLINNGNYSSGALNAVLTTASDKLEILDSEGLFPSIEPGNTGSNSGNVFNLSVPVSTFPGTTAPMTLTLNNANFFQTIDFEMTLGIPSSDDPLAPDNYGYYCYDNTDVNYEQAPDYNWIEISSLGTQVVLTDYGNEQDCSTIRIFPTGFTFRYYGQEYDRITICSNGWIAMGETPLRGFRNVPITGAEVPPACIAPFWDDLVLSSGGGASGKVYTYYDQTNGKYIIEWKEVHNDDGNWTLQTFEIILYDPNQYLTPTADGVIDFIYQTVNNDGSENNATVGIATPENGDGLQYTYSNIYTPGAAALANRRAIRFTTTGSDPATPPSIQVEPTALDIIVRPDSVTTTALNISNAGNSLLIYDISTDISAGIYTGGPDVYGNVFIDSDQPGGPVYQWLDITQTGTEVLFGGHDSTTAGAEIGFDFPFYDQIFQYYILSANGWLSFSSHANTRINLELPDEQAPFNLIAGCWDDLDPLAAGAEVWIWGNREDSLVVSYLNVPHYGTPVTSVYSFQMILTDDGSVAFQYQGITGQNNQYTIGIQNSDGTDGLTAAFDEQYIHAGLAIKFMRPVMNIVPASGGLFGGGTQEIAVSAFGYGLEEISYSGNLTIDCNDPLNPQLTVPVQIRIIPLATPQTEMKIIPEKFALLNISPNPFNPETNIRFAIAEKRLVKIGIYDVLGRLIAVLQDGNMEPGVYSLKWDASNSPTGLYFVRLQAGNDIQARKMILLK